MKKIFKYLELNRNTGMVEVGQFSIRDKNKAAIQIQTQSRKRMATRKVALLRQKIKNQEDAAVQLQSFYRGSQARGILKHQMRAQYAAELAGHGQKAKSEENLPLQANEKVEEELTAIKEKDERGLSKNSGKNDIRNNNKGQRELLKKQRGVYNVDGTQTLYTFSVCQLNDAQLLMTATHPGTHEVTELVVPKNEVESRFSSLDALVMEAQVTRDDNDLLHLNLQT
jgi:hypothetical protein